jgi:four helix bundle protein
MTEIQISKQKQYDLEERTLKFARRVNAYIKVLPRTISNIEIATQLTAAAGLVGANYIEANESFSKKDFAFRVKICRKESKESRYWLRLSEPITTMEQEKTNLIQEVSELMKIFGAILQKVS